MSLVWKNLTSPDLNPIGHFWEELDWRLQARPSHPTSVADLTNALWDEWAKIPTETLQKLVEYFPKRVQTVRAAKGRPTPC